MNHQLTYDQAFRQYNDMGYNLTVEICPDNNQVVYYRMRIEDYKIERMIITTSFRDMDSELIFNMLMTELQRMAAELDNFIFRNKNVYTRKVIIEKYQKPTK